MGSKDAPQKMQSLRAIKQVASLGREIGWSIVKPIGRSSLGTFIQNTKWCKNRTDSAITEPKQVRIPMFLHIPKAHEEGQI